MRKLLLIVFASILTLSAFAQKDPFAGFYKGKITLPDGSNVKGYPLGMYEEFFAEVYRGPNETYRLKVFTAIMARSEPYFVCEGLKVENGEIKLPEQILKGKITPTEIKATGKFAKYDISIDFKKFEFKSPTMGAKAPAGAIVLFDGTDPSKNWVMSALPAEPVNWYLKDGTMIVNSSGKKPDGKKLNSSIETKETFGPCRLHIEFKVPAMYDDMGQNRGNSGLFFGAYEVQMLDSFGTEGLWDNCGSIYRQTPPIVNASLEPEAWQTYDVEFYPAKVSKGEVLEFPKVTVYQNGVLIHKETIIYHDTSGSPAEGRKRGHSPAPFKIKLQDHNNPTAFRNIWVQPL